MTRRTRPITRHINRIVTGLRRVADSDTPKLTFASLVGAMGASSHRLLILMLTMLNMLPGPPGFGGFLAWTTFAVALSMVLGKPVRLPDVIGDRRLPLKPLLGASKIVARVTGVIARFSKPRLRWMTGAAATLPYGLFAMFISVFMTLPIPFINAVPNAGLCVLAFAMLNRDGLAVMVGLAISAAGLVTTTLLLFGIYKVAVTTLGAPA